MAREVSFMAGGIFSDRNDAVTVRHFDGEERENIRLMMRELAAASPLAARSLIKRRIMLASEAISAGISTMEGASFDLSLHPDHVLDGLPYLEKIDDLVDPETMAIINASTDEEGGNSG